MGNRLAVSVLAAVLFCASWVIAGSESTVTATPKGAVMLTETNGQVVRLTTSFPVKTGCLMETSGGTCIMRGPQFRLTAQDKASFAFRKVGDKWVMNLNAGRVHYVLHPEPTIYFSHADAVYELTKITPAVEGGNVEGIVEVVGDKLVFANSAGELVLVANTAGVEAEPLVVGPSAAGGVGSAAMGLGAAGAAAAGTGAAIGLTSGNSTTSQQ